MKTKSEKNEVTILRKDLVKELAFQSENVHSSYTCDFMCGGSSCGGSCGRCGYCSCSCSCSDYATQKIMVENY
jgi:hypothetical protein